MKHYYALLLLVFPFIGFSQCPTTPMTLSSQAEVDAFATNYPDCTELQNALTISGADITDLTPLSAITSVYTLGIVNNPLLENLQGLNNVNSFTGFYGLSIQSNDLLANISALGNMTNGSDIGSIVVSNNPLLSSLDGLQGIQGYTSAIDIFNNDSLINLTGLNNITSADDFYVTNNDSLINLVGLDSCSGGAVVFEDNVSLQNLVGLTSAFSAGLVALVNNDSLESLQGIEAITSTADLHLDGNDSLTDISALTALTPGNPSFPEISITIKNNINLEICHIDAICSALSSCNSGDLFCTLDVENNATGCNSISEIENNCGTSPENDDCEDALSLTFGVTLEANNLNATASAQTPSCNDVNRLDVWFTVNSGSFTSLDIITEAGYSLQLWEGDCASLMQVASACAEGSLNDIAVTTNTDYYVQVWSDSEARQSQRATGLFDILVQDGTLRNQEFAFEGFSLYPNPVKNELNLKANSNITSIAIYNLLGQEVLRTNPNSVQTSINTTGLKTGIYLVKVGIGNSVATYKVVKE